MSFLKPEIYYGTYFAVETSHGTEIVPGHMFTRTVATNSDAFADYVEGKILDTDELIPVSEGWLIRLSASGYLDCTEWSAFPTEKEAKLWAEKLLGDD